MFKAIGLFLALLLPLSATADTVTSFAGYAQARVNDGYAEAELGVGGSVQYSDNVDFRLIASFIADKQDSQPRLNIGLVDLHTSDNAFGARLGRVQHQLGFYTAQLNWVPARDMHLAPQGIYRENFRYLLRSGDGIQPYVNFNVGDARFDLEFTYTPKPVLFQQESLSRVYLPVGELETGDASVIGLNAGMTYGPLRLRYDQQRLNFNQAIFGAKYDISTVGHYFGARYEATQTVDLTIEGLIVDKSGFVMQAPDKPAVGYGISASWQATDEIKLIGGVSAFYNDPSNKKPIKFAYTEDLFLAAKYRQDKWISTLEVHKTNGVATMPYHEQISHDEHSTRLILTVTRMF